MLLRIIRFKEAVMKKMKVALAIVALLAVVLISVAFLDKGELKYTNSPYYEEMDDIFVFNTREGLDDYIKTNNEKYLLDVAVEDILRFEAELFEFVDTKYPEIPEAIRTDKEIKEETETKLIKAIEECKAQFK